MLSACLGKASEPVLSFQADIVPILNRYCIRCHDANNAKADLRIDVLTNEFEGAELETWHDVLNRISVGEMPPQEADALPTAQRRKLTSWIRRRLTEGQKRLQPGGGAVVRRLTRYEYNNTLRDLTGIELDYSKDLPPDSSSLHGFKNNGSALGISAIQLEYYLRAARNAMEKAIVSGPAPKVYRHKFETSSPSNAPKNKAPVGNRMKPGGRFFGKMLEFPREGAFVVRVKAGAVVPEGQGVPRMQISIGLRSDTVSPTKLLGEVDVTASETDPQVYEFKGRMEAFPLPGHNPKFPGVTIGIANVYDDGLPPAPALTFPVVKLSRAESKQVASKAKKNTLVLPFNREFGFSQNGKLEREFAKLAANVQRKVEELRLVDRESDASIDLACRLFEVNSLMSRLKNSLKLLAKERDVDVGLVVEAYEEQNREQLKDNNFVLSKFQHLNPVNRKDKTAIRALLPPEAPRTTLVVESLEFEGPVYDQWPPQTHRTLLPELSHVPGSDREAASTDTPRSERLRAELAIGKFMKRAFRRPVRPADISYVLEFYDEVRTKSETFEEAIREAFVMVLVSPEFLYHIQPNRSPEGQELTVHEFATRLSYFLWSTMPDQELTQLADSGRLLDPGVIEQQVRRLLQSTQSSEFVEHFTDQWLDLAGIERIAINPEYYPGFDNGLKSAMQHETHAFFALLLNQNLSALNLLDSDFVTLNRVMADHYGISGPKGSVFERVELPENSIRGGLLTQAGVLLLNSTGEDSHPIRRAVWVRSRLLDDAPAPPPPDVPELDTDSHETVGLSVRQQLELHRKREACNDCHRGIDPWGIPFENFDAIGQFRKEATRVVSKGRKTLRVGISADSVLPNGTKLQGMNDLKKYLAQDEKRRFARTLVSRLLEYGMGRDIVFEDRASLEKLTDQFEANGFRLSDLVVAIVQSKLFQTK